MPTFTRAHRVPRDGALGDFAEIVVAVCEAHTSGLDAGHVEQIFDQPAQPLDAFVHRPQRLVLRRGQRAELAVDQELHVADDRGHRRRELVRDVSVKLLARLIELAQARVGRR